ncbi:cuticle protein 76-like [Bacillus rossius redtenbacheri]|uniref:cuticle protein 76-like n=1 Tax=Bacillus rossius redtenbacheri TaxID=93214 RepID=UPI002FDE3FAF
MAAFGSLALSWDSDAGVAASAGGGANDLRPRCSGHSALKKFSFVAIFPRFLKPSFDGLPFWSLHTSGTISRFFHVKFLFFCNGFFAFQFIVLAVVVAVAKAGYLGAPAVAAYGAPAYGYGGYAAPAYAHGGYASPAITSQHSNILRTPGNLGQVSTYSKTIDTPYSSVSKSDVRVSNDALAYGAAYHAPAYGAYADPALAAHTYAAPALAAHAYAAPALAARAVAPGLLGVAYSAAPVVSHMTYSNAYGIHYTY